MALAPGSVDAAGTPVAAGVIGTFQDAAAPDTTPPALGDVAVRVSGPCLQVTFTTDETAAATVTVSSGGVQIDTAAGAGQTRFDVAIPLGGLPAAGRRHVVRERGGPGRQSGGALRRSRS